MDTKELKEMAERAQEDLLTLVLEIFKTEKDRVVGPAKITEALGLSKRLEVGEDQHNDRIAQGLINELRNRGKLKYFKGSGCQYIAGAEG